MTKICEQLAHCITLRGMSDVGITVAPCAKCVFKCSAMMDGALPDATFQKILPQIGHFLAAISSGVGGHKGWSAGQVRFGSPHPSNSPMSETELGVGVRLSFDDSVVSRVCCGHAEDCRINLFAAGWNGPLPLSKSSSSEHFVSVVRGTPAASELTMALRRRFRGAEECDVKILEIGIGAVGEVVMWAIVVVARRRVVESAADF